MIDLSPKVRRAFFARFGGRLRPIQEAALAMLKPGRDALLTATTGGGKTEAVFAPLADQLLRGGPSPHPRLRVLVISPTRALASDLHRRMAPVFDELGLRLDVATSDRRTRSAAGSDALIKTPEGLDSEISRRADWLGGIDEVVIDEAHKFVDDPRGTQLVGLLTRLQAKSLHRRIAISATVPDTSAMHRVRLLRTPVVIEDPAETGEVEVCYHQWLGSDGAGPDRFVGALRKMGVRKAIGFVGRRARAETLAHMLDRGYLKGKCYPHHADLSAAARRQVEGRLRDDPVALVIATSTLEVGIDVGDIDACVLFDAPPSQSAFLQRAGRSGRRSGKRRVVCVAGLYDRRIDFARLLPPMKAPIVDCRPFLAGCLQQILSVVAERETETRLAVETLVAEAFGLTHDTTHALLTVLVREGWLELHGEDLRSSERLLELQNSRAIHVTFATGGGSSIVDESSGRHLGRSLVRGGEPILLGGKGRRPRGVDPLTKAVLVGTAAGGSASFSARPLSVFQLMALKYGHLTGGQCRPPL